MTTPLVSVIIPAYNCAGVLCDTIDSILGQTYGNIEVVVVDDGSIDQTGKVVQKYLDKKEVRYLRQENGGPGAARNRGILAARGDYIAFTDADDCLPRDSIEKRMSLIAEVRGLELLYSNHHIAWSGREKEVRFEESYPEQFRSICRDYGHGVVFEGDPAENFRCAFDFWTGTVLVSRDLVERAGLFRTDISIGEDRDMWIRLSMSTRKIGYIGEPLACYNRSGNGLTGGDPVRYARARIDLNRYFLEKYGKDDPTGKIRKVVDESMSWIFFDLGKHYRGIGMKGRAVESFLKSIRRSPKNKLPYREIASIVTPRVLRETIKRHLRPGGNNQSHRLQDDRILRKRAHQSRREP